SSISKTRHRLCAEQWRHHQSQAAKKQDCHNNQNLVSQERTERVERNRSQNHVGYSLPTTCIYNSSRELFTGCRLTTSAPEAHKSSTSSRFRSSGAVIRKPC